MEVHEKIKEIKAQFRLYMNGVASQTMRERGLDYKLNFGIEVPRIKEIAAKFEKNHEVAQALWKENIRECKILAGLLQPVDTFYPEIADIWVEDMRYPEIAELTCMNLFQHLPYASQKVFEWMASEELYFQLCGYLVMARLLMRGSELTEQAEVEFIDHAIVALQDENSFLQKCATTALRKYAAQSKKNAQKIVKELRALESSPKPYVAICVAEVKNELEYWN
ncbi:MAG: DNA alkylation repair protein [Phocaeicola sp.]